MNIKTMLYLAIHSHYKKLRKLLLTILILPVNEISPRSNSHMENGSPTGTGEQTKYVIL